MADGSTIEWTDATWNPVRGCTRISPGCGGPNRQGGCYAETIAARFSGPGQPFEGLAERTPHGGRWTGRLAAAPDETLTQPLRWKRPRRIFVNSMSDLFHEALPDETIDRVFAVMALCPQHTFQVLTKRAARMRDYVEQAAPRIVPTLINSPGAIHESVYIDDKQVWPLPNVWLGVSTEDQAHADERIPHLLATPAAKRFISAEPLLGPVDFRWAKWDDWRSPIKGVERKGVTDELDGLRMLDWIIAGGESGPRARPMHPDWARSLRDQCAAAQVPFFFKQWGEWAAEIDRDRDDPDWRRDYGRAEHKAVQFQILNAAGGCGFHGERVHLMHRVGKKAAGALLDGKLHREFPT